MPRKRSKQRKTSYAVIDKIIWGLYLILAMILLWWFTWMVMGDGAPNLGYINAGGVIFAAFAILIAIFLFIRKKWVGGPIGLIIGLGLLAQTAGFNFAASEEKLRDSDIRIMSSSLRGLNKDMAGTANHLAQYGADIIGVQEISDPIKFQQALEKATGKTWNMEIQNNLALFSHFPLNAEDIMQNGVLMGEVTINGQALAIWTLRAPKDYKRPAVNRQFFRELSRNIDEKQPIAVIGDYNSTPWNDGYAIISQKMSNAHVKAGFGLGSTFPGPARNSGALGAFARIDHIFLKNNVRNTNAFTGDAPKGSDHHPVIADIQITNINISQ